jgi:hypothetical protein
VQPFNGSASIKIERTNSIPQTILQLTPRALAIAPNAALPSRGSEPVRSIDWRQRGTTQRRKKPAAAPKSRALSGGRRSPGAAQLSGGRARRRTPGAAPLSGGRARRSSPAVRQPRASQLSGGRAALRRPRASQLSGGRARRSSPGAASLAVVHPEVALRRIHAPPLASCARRQAPTASSPSGSRFARLGPPSPGEPRAYSKSQ